jgi:hypothetical protein
MAAAHVVIGITAIASAHSAVAERAYSIAIICASIVYVSWLSRRVAGISVALATGMFEILSRPHPPEVFFVGLVRTLGYVVLAWLVSAIEVATRPSPRR